MRAEQAHEAGDGTRERKRVLLLCAGAVLLLAPTDPLSLGHFSWRPLAVRLAWSLFIAITAVSIRGADAKRVREMMLALAVLSAALCTALAALTGGAGSSLFHVMLALPVVIALVIQDQPSATIAAGITLLGGGMGILIASGASLKDCWQWTAQAAIFTALAAYASGVYGRLHAREAALRQASADASARARASEAAIAARDEFLAIAAHELRTPLTSLLLQIEAVERSVTTGSGAVSERIGIVGLGRQARRLSALIDGMLDVTRLTAGKLELIYEKIDLSVLAREVVQRFRADAAAAKCTLKVDLPEPLVGTWDEARLDQILTNLLGNALKYGAGGAIEVEGRGDAENVRLTVRDHGIGISSMDQQRIFQRFQRASGQRQHPGLGLGLWISSELCKALGGRIGVASALGAGAAFTVDLPRQSAEARAALHPRVPNVTPWQNDGSGRR
jgi:signal transduction histidine kinase